jgi:hypothetical protein
MTDSLSCTCSTPVYLSNTDRERLGLFGFGSDVPDEVVADAEAALAARCGGACPAPAPKTTKRARNKKGEFEGDNPATSEVNEAYVAG